MIAVLLAAGCGHDATHASAVGASSSTPTTRPPSTRPASTPSPTTNAPAIDASYRARATGSTVDVYATPDAAAPTQTLPNPWNVDPRRPGATVPQVFLVDPGATVAGWVHVFLPVRPNGSAGWVRASAVTVEQVDYRVVVRLGTHHITVTHLGTPIYDGPVATGKPSTPTPTGNYYTRVLIRAVDPNTVYGPYAYGLSSHSDALSSFDGGDAEIGLHGNNDASVLGRSVTHGCIRMDNAEITRLSALLPLGTPVIIQP